MFNENRARGIESQGALGKYKMPQIITIVDVVVLLPKQHMQRIRHRM